MPHKKIDEHTLEVLEFDQVRQILGSFTASSLGQQAALELYPSTDIDWIAGRLAETTELKNLLERGLRLPLAGLHDIRPHLDQIGTKQTVLEPAQLLEIAETLAVSGRLKTFFQDLSDPPVEHLHTLAEKLDDFEPIVTEINRCVENEQSLRDTASPQLRDIRRTVGRLGTEIQQKCKDIIAAPDMRVAVENDRFLTRNSRAVIAVKFNYRQRLQGVILDRSNSGATLYVEPYALTSLSNELEDALSAEKKEIWRILWELTKMVLDVRSDILRNLKVLTWFDLILAKTRFSITYHMSPPEVSPNSSLHLRQARHPLLLQWAGQQKNAPPSQVRDDIVPIDVRLGDDFDLLLVTGPNTGGKTVALKTIGLLTLMAQAGLHVPAWPDSRIPVYRKVYADIGDEQSIQQSLSTFSAHIGQIVRILNGADDHSLVLIDELGAGTDPSEGAVLGTTILDELLASGARVVATSHLGRLKSYAYTTPRAENASVLFDTDTLKPTYQLLIGTPGSSNALAIAHRLGISKSLIDKAHALLADAADGTSDLLNQVQMTREAAEQNRAKTQSLLDQVKAMQRLASERLARTAEERDRLTEYADKCIDSSLRKVRERVNEFLTQIQNAPKPWSELAQHLAAQIAEEAASTPLALRRAEFIETLRKGDTVQVLPFQRQATILRIHRKRKVMLLLMDGKEIEVPFSEIWEP